MVSSSKERFCDGGNYEVCRENTKNTRNKQNLHCKKIYKILLVGVIQIKYKK